MAGRKSQCRVQKPPRNWQQMRDEDRREVMDDPMKYREAMNLCRRMAKDGYTVHLELADDFMGRMKTYVVVETRTKNWKQVDARRPEGKKLYGSVR